MGRQRSDTSATATGCRGRGGDRMLWWRWLGGDASGRKSLAVSRGEEESRVRLASAWETLLASSLMDSFGTENEGKQVGDPQVGGLPKGPKNGPREASTR